MRGVNERSRVAQFASMASLIINADEQGADKGPQETDQKCEDTHDHGSGVGPGL